RVVRVNREDGHDDLHLVAKTGDERRTQRTVDETAGQDRLGRGATLTTEERAGDLAGGVGTLFDVDRQREEVKAVTGRLARRGGGQQHRLAVKVGGDGSGSLLGETSCLEADRAGAELAVVDNALAELDFGTYHLKVCVFQAT